MKNKSTLWSIKALVLVDHLVNFEEPVSANEAREKFLEEDYEDIIDEEILEPKTVHSVRILKD